MKPMRRKKQQLDTAETRALLAAGTHGVLSLADEDGLPYGVPVNYAYLDGPTEDGRLIFHSAQAGRKVEAIRNGAPACFTVIAQAQVDSAHFLTDYRSVIAEGTVRPLEGEEAREALLVLARRFNPDEAACQAEVAKDGPRCVALAFDIETMSGKESLGLMRQRAR